MHVKINMKNVIIHILSHKIGRFPPAALACPKAICYNQVE